MLHHGWEVGGVRLHHHSLHTSKWSHTLSLHFHPSCPTTRPSLQPQPCRWATRNSALKNILNSYKNTLEPKIILLDSHQKKPKSIILRNALTFLNKTLVNKCCSKIHGHENFQSLLHVGNCNYSDMHVMDEVSVELS